MNIEEARQFALSLPFATEDLFVEEWLSFRVGGKWFMTIWLTAPQQQVAVKLPPEEGALLREDYDGINPAYHLNKRHWSDLYLDSLPQELVKQLIQKSHSIVLNSLPKKIRESLSEGLNL